MEFFNYKIADAEGQIFKGLVEAKDDDEARKILEDEGYSVLSLKPRSAALKAASFLQRVSAKEMVIMSRQLSILISANLHLVDALKTLAKQTRNEKLKLAVSQVADRVEGGKKLSQSLAEHPTIFSNFYVKLVETGERVGKLDEVLEYLASEQEKNYDLRSRIRGMLIYPAFIFVMLIVIVIFMLTFVMPKMLSILKESNIELPLSTRILIGVSTFFQSYWWLVILLILTLVILFSFYIKTVSGRRYWDLLKLKIPVVGKIIQNVAMVRFSNSLAILLRGGVDMVVALKTVAGVIGNTQYQIVLTEAIKEVEDGSLLAASLVKSEYVPYMVIEIIEAGEKTGHIEKSLEKITNFYTREVNNSVANLVSLIEPLVIILIGTGVGLLVVAMILPMYKLAGAG
jgi:type IV pilus assembly protein PilC